MSREGLNMIFYTISPNATQQEISDLLFEVRNAVLDLRDFEKDLRSVGLEAGANRVVEIAKELLSKLDPVWVDVATSERGEV
jgi:hypothetical protein